MTSLQSDLKFEIFGMDPASGINNFHICQAHMDGERKGDQIEAIQEDPVYQDTYYEGQDGAVSNSIS